MTDRPFGADCATPHPSSGLAALPVEVIAPDPEFTAHGNTVLPVGVLQSDGEKWRPVARVVLSPDERARLIARLLEHEGLYETASPAEAIALTGQHHPGPVDVPGPVQALAVEVARLEAHVEELTVSRDKMATQIAADVVRRAELEEWLGRLEASFPPDLDSRLRRAESDIVDAERSIRNLESDVQSLESR